MREYRNEAVDYAREVRMGIAEAEVMRGELAERRNRGRPRTVTTTPEQIRELRMQWPRLIWAEVAQAAGCSRAQAIRILGRLRVDGGLGAVKSASVDKLHRVG